MLSFQQGGLTIFQSALFQTNSAVVQGQDFVLVSDPTWLPQEVAEIAAFVQNIRAGRTLYLLLTHSDYDHIWGTGAFPDAVVVASRLFADNPDKEKSVRAARAWDSEYYVCRPYEIDYPQVNIALERDGEQLVLGGARLTFYGAPGHTPDGMLTVVEPDGILIAGDYLSDIEFPLIGQSSMAYESTLAKLDGVWERHTVSLLVPGHGQVTADLQEMRQRRQHALGYIHALRQYVQAGDQSAINAMLEECAFGRGMTAFHERNQARMRAEELAGEQESGQG